jgi:hypothetical protein
MKQRTRTILAWAMVIGSLGIAAAPALAGQPGPGDKQCIPGQQGNPHPAFKAGVCPNP